MTTVEYAVGLIIEQYGPIGALAVVLWYRQSQMIKAIVDLAEQQEAVNADEVAADIRIRSDDD